MLSEQIATICFGPLVSSSRKTSLDNFPLQMLYFKAKLSSDCEGIFQSISLIQDIPLQCDILNHPIRAFDRTVLKATNQIFPAQYFSHGNALCAFTLQFATLNAFLNFPIQSPISTYFNLPVSISYPIKYFNNTLLFGYPVRYLNLNVLFSYPFRFICRTAIFSATQS